MSLSRSAGARLTFLLTAFTACGERLPLASVNWMH
jgi:hypothetical protein